MFLLISGFTLINTNSFPLFQMEGVYNLLKKFYINLLSNYRRFFSTGDIPYLELPFKVNELLFKSLENYQQLITIPAGFIFAL